MQAIARIRQNSPYESVVMIGDGITDLEAVQTSGGADLFIGCVAGSCRRGALHEMPGNCTKVQKPSLGGELAWQRLGVMGWMDV